MEVSDKFNQFNLRRRFYSVPFLEFNFISKPRRRKFSYVMNWDWRRKIRKKIFFFQNWFSFNFFIFIFTFYKKLQLFLLRLLLLQTCFVLPKRWLLKKCSFSSRRVHDVLKIKRFLYKSGWKYMAKSTGKNKRINTRDCYREWHELVRNEIAGSSVAMRKNSISTRKSADDKIILDTFGKKKKKLQDRENSSLMQCGKTGCSACVCLCRCNYAIR